MAAFVVPLALMTIGTAPPDAAPQYGGIVVGVDRRLMVVVVDDAGVVPDAGQLAPAHASQQLD